MKVLAVVQARMGSTRLPNKVMKTIDSVPMIEVLLGRLSRSTLIDKIILATSVGSENEDLAKHVKCIGYDVFQGDENDVLDRIFQASMSYSPEYVVRITGDCPLIDPSIVDSAIEKIFDSRVDYVSNVEPPTFPDGLDVEVFRFSALEKAWNCANAPNDREHVTQYIRNSGEFSKENIALDTDYSSERWTVDEPEDFNVIKGIFGHFSPNVYFGWDEVLQLKNQKPDMFLLNQHLVRNEGAAMGTGQKLWKRAKKVIPGGNMLLSKRAEMFLPEQWPAYFSKSKGCDVWDLDGRKYVDMSIMGIGTNILGYGSPEVDDVVRQVVDNGNMSTFNCPEEVYLAERLVEIHSWADMVRFARTGGEANSIAVRIARAAAGKEKVAFCGYHGWHDWYLATNLGSEANLAGHLLPGLEPNGVPSSLKDTIYPFSYNNFDELESLVKQHDIGVIKMEVSRNFGPEDGFLQKVRNLATDKGIVLIFDECTSGFRQTFGGLHKMYGVEPDLAVFGKAMGNGYAITAVIGRKEVMESAQTSFISSTFWTERIGPSAALKTLEVMENISSWKTITETGKNITKRWEELAQKYELKINTSGLPALTSFSFDSPNSLAYKTLITQEMLAKGYLASNSVYVCTEHKNDVIEGYFEAIEPIFSTIKECENGRDVFALLNGPVCHSGFRRLN